MRADVEVSHDVARFGWTRWTRADYGLWTEGRIFFLPAAQKIHAYQLSDESKCVSWTLESSDSRIKDEKVK